MSDLVASMGLTIFPLIGLVIFGVVFVAVSVRALLTSRSACERWSSLPLDLPEEGPARTKSASSTQAEGC